MSIPIQIETVADVPQPGTGAPGPGLRATCTKCGTCAEVVLGRKRAEAVEAVCDAMADACPTDAGNRYRGRVIPAGVTLWFLHADGRRYPLDVTGRVVHGAMGAVKPEVAQILVLPETRKHADAAMEFGNKLYRWGYQKVKVLPPAAEKAGAES